MSGASVPGDRRRILPAWLTEGRLLAYCRLIAAGYLALALALHLTAARQAADGQIPLVTDFNTFFAVPLLLQSHPAAAAYDRAAMAMAERQAIARAYPRLDDGQLSRIPLFAWLYPPPALLLVAPLGALPYWLAYIAWNGVTLAVWLAALRRIRPAPGTVAMALALPATFLNGMFGQMGFLVAGLTGLGLTLLEKRPWLAGVAFGLLAIKPHFALLLPVALAAGGHWRTMAAGGVTALAIAGLSLLAIGTAPWAAFFTHAGEGGRLLASGAVPWTLMPTVFPAARLLGLPAAVASLAQAAATVVAVLLVASGWRRTAPLAHKAALLCLATLFALPFAYAYDLVLLTLPLFWMAGDDLAGRRTMALLGLGALLPFLGPGLANLGLPVAPLVIGSLLWVAWRRTIEAAQ